MKVFDLTMPIDERTPVFPGDVPLKFTQVETIESIGANVTRFEFGSHFGTHIDAPYHMLADGKRLSDFPMEHFVGEAVILALNDDFGQVQTGDIVFFYTGHTDQAYEPDFFENNPVISESLAKQLVDKKVRIVGLDSFTPDNAPYTIHKLFFKHDIMIVENLVNLKPLLGKRFQCVIAPLKVTNGDGAPCRVIGIL